MLSAKGLTRRSAEFELILVLPRTTFAPGDQIPFEVKIENPHGVLIEYLTVTLTQTFITLITKKHRFSRSNSSKSLKSTTNTIASESSGHGYHDTSWFGYMKIPRSIPPTILASQSRSPLTDIIENRYSLQIKAAQCEHYPLLSQEYPIVIDLPRNYQRNLPNPRQHQLDTNVTPSRTRSPMRRGTSLLTCSPCASPIGPPRYSSLSLNSISLDSERSRSFETLPPNYEDLPTTSTGLLSADFLKLQ